MKRWFLFLVLMQAGLFAESVRLFNDSPYILRVVIQGRDGGTLGELVLNPGHSSGWNNNAGQVGVLSPESVPKPSDRREGVTPFTVLWYCQNGDTYSMCSQVPTGTTVTAQSCQGSRQCKRPPPAQGQQQFQVPQGLQPGQQGVEEGSPLPSQPPSNFPAPEQQHTPLQQ